MMNEQTLESQRSTPAALAATVLRALGAGATIFGALIFMLQGFDHIELAWRPWFYPAFVVLLGTGGAASLYLFRDARGARLFLGLATALVPVQATQLGGMLHALLHGSTHTVPGIFQSGPVSASLTALVAGVSAVVLPVASWAGFRILARRHAASLWVSFLALSALLLLPERASPAGLAVIVALSGAFLWLERTRFGLAPEFATWEGWAVRLMFLLPLGIALVRCAFYLAEPSALAALFAVAGATLLLMIRSEFRAWIAEGLRALAGVCLVAAWLLLVIDVLTLGHAYLWFALLFPIGLVLALIGHFAPRSGALYRGLGVAFMTLASYALLDASNALSAWLIVAAIGAGICFAATRYRERIAVFVGAFQAAIGMLGTVILSLRAIDMNAWLALAAIGMALVLLSSAAERYGFGLSQLRRLARRRAQNG